MVDAPKFSQVITGNATSGTFTPKGLFYASAYKAPGSTTFSATVSIEKSMNDGVTWLIVPRNENNDPATYNAAFSFLIEETNVGMLYRFVVTSFAGNPIVVEFR